MREVTVEDPTAPPARPAMPERRGPSPGAAPVEIFTPDPGAVVPIEELLRRVLPEIRESIGVIRNLPQWIEDDAADLPKATRAAMQDKLEALTSHAARVEAGLRAADACAQLADHRLRPRRLDPAPIIEQVVRRRMFAAGRTVEMRIELPPVVSDAALLGGIVAGLCDAAVANARRDSDRVEIRAIHIEGTVRLSVLYPGPPRAGAALFLGTPRKGAMPPAAALGLAYVWHAVARLRGRIELGPGFRGEGARITVVLPPITCESGTIPPP